MEQKYKTSEARRRASNKYRMKLKKTGYIDYLRKIPPSFKPLMDKYLQRLKMEQEGE